MALQQPRQPDRSEEPQLQPVDGWDLTAETVDALSELDEGSRGFVANHYNQRWGSGELSPRARALVCITADVLNQTLDGSFSLQIDLALAAGAGDEKARAVLLLVAEYGIAKVWRAHRPLMAR